MTRHVRRGFTLIELLVVVAIIALLIGILLPSLAAARESARAMKCQANFRSVGQVALLYANENDDQLWPSKPYFFEGVAHPTLPGFDAFKDWAFLYGRQTGGVDQRVGPGLVYEYISNVDELFECPSNRRRGYAGLSVLDRNGFADFPESLAGDGLVFDYTMLGAASGAKTYLDFFFAAVRPDGRTPAQAPILNLDTFRLLDRGERIVQLRTLPVYLEESAFWNTNTHDGRFESNDELSERHNGAANIAALDGSVRQIRPNAIEPEGSITAQLNPNGTLSGVAPGFRDTLAIQADSMYVRTRGKNYVGISQQPASSPFARFDTHYGWINAATLNP